VKKIGFLSLGHLPRTQNTPLRTFSTLLIEKLARPGERSPEKAGVGGSTPSLATKSSEINLLPAVVNPSHLLEIS
jgi:hypothetical protein